MENPELEEVQDRCLHVEARRVGRCHYVCPACGQDVSLVVMMEGNGFPKSDIPCAPQAGLGGAE